MADACHNPACTKAARFTCAQCGTARYCSRACHVRAWSKHRLICAPPKQQCMICLEAWPVAAFVPIPGCRHQLCSTCAAQWDATNRTDKPCPLCQKDVRDVLLVTPHALEVLRDHERAHLVILVHGQVEMHDVCLKMYLCRWRLGHLATHHALKATGRWMIRDGRVKTGGGGGGDDGDGTPVWDAARRTLPFVMSRTVELEKPVVHPRPLELAAGAHHVLLPLEATPTAECVHLITLLRANPRVFSSQVWLDDHRATWWVLSIPHHTARALHAVRTFEHERDATWFTMCAALEEGQTRGRWEAGLPRSAVRCGVQPPLPSTSSRCAHMRRVGESHPLTVPVPVLYVHAAARKKDYERIGSCLTPALLDMLE